MSEDTRTVYQRIRDAVVAERGVQLTQMQVKELFYEERIGNALLDAARRDDESAAGLAMVDESAS